MIRLFHSFPENCVMAISGGVDSIAAAHYLVRRGLINRLYHFNHKMQPANDQMEASVIRFAKDFNCSLELRYPSCDITTEANARKQRIDDYFAAKSGAFLITAHHLDDCVESYLLNVIRGKAEYLPIPLVSQFGVGKRLIHAFLLNNKKDFENYACKHDLSKYIVSDPTNTVNKGSRRNMIRNEIVPILRREMVGLDTIVRKKFYSEHKPIQIL